MRKIDPEELRKHAIARQKKWDDKHRDNIKNNQLKYRFGISLKEYNEMFQLQNGRCAICGKHQSELSKSLSVDHNHDTKEIRGLLCQNCNSVLGHALDNVEILRACIDYLIGEI